MSMAASATVACAERFRDWLKARYETLDNLNHARWSTFWSHTYSDWSQIESPAPQGKSPFMV